MRDQSEKFSYAGSFSKTPFIRVLFHLHSSKANGTLRVQTENMKKLVTFENGEPKFVVSNLERECLGRVLVAKGRLTEEECRTSLAAMSRLKKRQGETLIQLGLLEPYELDEALRVQARDKFMDLFGWREGGYRFISGKAFEKDLTPLDLSLPQLCLRGVRQHYHLPALQEVLGPNLNTKPRFKIKGMFSVEDFRLATWDSRVVPQIRRGKTLQEILKLNLAREIDVYHLFYTFLVLDVIEFAIDEGKVEGAERARLEDRPQQVSPFEVLGVSMTATDVDVRQAFQEKMEALDSVAEQSEKERGLKEAYETIGSIEGKRAYLIRLYEESGSLPRGVSGVFQAVEFVSTGKSFIASKDLARARKVFLDGAALFPEHSVILAYLGYVSVLQLARGGELAGKGLAGKEFDRGKKAVIKATQMMSDEPETHYLVAKVFILERDFEKAQKALNRTLTLSPSHKEAKDDLKMCQRKVEQDKKANRSFVKWKG